MRHGCSLPTGALETGVEPEGAQRDLQSSEGGGGGQEVWLPLYLHPGSSHPQPHEPAGLAPATVICQCHAVWGHRAWGAELAPGQSGSLTDWQMGGTPRRRFPGVGDTSWKRGWASTHPQEAAPVTMNTARACRNLRAKRGPPWQAEQDVPGLASTSGTSTSTRRPWMPAPAKTRAQACLASVHT